jgi:hypothetical protein
MSLLIRAASLCVLSSLPRSTDLGELISFLTIARLGPDNDVAVCWFVYKPVELNLTERGVIILYTKCPP